MSVPYVDLNIMIMLHHDFRSPLNESSKYLNNRTFFLWMCTRSFLDEECEQNDFSLTTSRTLRNLAFQERHKKGSLVSNNISESCDWRKTGVLLGAHVKIPPTHQNALAAASSLALQPSQDRRFLLDRQQTCGFYLCSHGPW